MAVFDKKKINKKFSAVFFFNFCSLKPWIRIGSGSGLVFIPKMLDPDPDEMNADPQPWCFGSGSGRTRIILARIRI
jgi:hypothetical protein